MKNLGTKLRNAGTKIAAGISGAAMLASIGCAGKNVDYQPKSLKGIIELDPQIDKCIIYRSGVKCKTNFGGGTWVLFDLNYDGLVDFAELSSSQNETEMILRIKEPYSFPGLLGLFNPSYLRNFENDPLREYAVNSPQIQEAFDKTKKSPRIFKRR